MSAASARWLCVAVPGPCAEGAWLAPEERERAAALRVPARRTDWLLGRLAAKRALAADLGLSGEARELRRIAVRAADDGAPEPLLDGAPLARAISLSHRSGTALCAVADAGVALGCDLERAEPRSAAFVRDVFTGDEQQWLAGVPRPERDAAVAFAWSAKEAALKLVRSGLRRDTRDAEVLPCRPVHGRWRPFRVCLRPEGRTLHGWARRQGPLVLTVASDPPAPPPRPVERDVGTAAAVG